MKINIYYGGRGLIDDPTLFVLNKMQEVLEGININLPNEICLKCPLWMITNRNNAPITPNIAPLAPAENITVLEQNSYTKDNILDEQTESIPKAETGKHKVPIITTVLVVMNVFIFLLCTFTGDLLYNIGAISYPSSHKNYSPGLQKSLTGFHTGLSSST